MNEFRKQAKNQTAMASECTAVGETAGEACQVTSAEPESAFPASGRWDHTLAFFMLRGWLAVRAIVTGIDKYAATTVVQQPLIDPLTGMEDPSGAMIEVKTKVYALTNYSAMPASLQDRIGREPLLPHVAVAPFEHILGPALILTGVMLLLGVGTRVSLVIQGLIYIALTAGLILIGQDNGVAWLGIHIGLVALALMLARYNRFALIKTW
jgi:thiosulfate dehydrogenase [quinone] large subunit